MWRKYQANFLGSNKMIPNRNYKTWKIRKQLKKIKANIEAAPRKGSFKQMFKASIHSKRFWLQEKQVTSKNEIKILRYDLNWPWYDIKTNFSSFHFFT